MEVSAERKANCVTQVRDERQYVIDCGGFSERGGCAGCPALHELIMSCSYISDVVVVMRIVMGDEFL